MEWVCSKILISTSIQHANKVHRNSYIDKVLIVYKYLRQIMMHHTIDDKDMRITLIKYMIKVS